MHHLLFPATVACVLLGASLLAGCQSLAHDAVEGAQPTPAVTGLTHTGSIDDRALRELSGLAVSPGRPERLWALNDGNNPAELFLLATDGEVLARYPVVGVANVDWEDLAAFTWQGTAYLLIADIGDNRGRRETVELHMIREPSSALAERPAPTSLIPVASLRFGYADGPRDAEGVAVDPAHAEILVLSKREAEPAFYRLPLRLDATGEVLVAERIGHLALDEKRFDPPGSPVTRSLFGASPTAIDLDGRGRTLALLTYTAVYRLQREAEETWPAALERPFTRLADHALEQAEALALDPGGETLWFTGEKVPAPLWRLDLDAE